MYTSPELQMKAAHLSKCRQSESKTVADKLRHTPKRERRQPTPQKDQPAGNQQVRNDRPQE